MEDHSYIIGIPSYDRVNYQPCLEMLHSFGFERSRMVLATQDIGDYEKYAERYGNIAQVIYKGADNVAKNRNTILDHVCKEYGDMTSVLMLDDKVRGIQILGRNGKLETLKTKDEVDGFIKAAFRTCKQIGGRVFGCITCANTFYMKHTISTNQQMIGRMMGIVQAGEQMFDEKLSLKEDFEYILRHVSKGNTTVRFNDVSVLATDGIKGGCRKAWDAKGDSVNKSCNEYIMRRYPKLVKAHKTRTNEQRYVGTSMVINISILDLI